MNSIELDNEEGWEEATNKGPTMTSACLEIKRMPSLVHLAQLFAFPELPLSRTGSLHT